jgi:quercetin dioxygenase-like cupin family protein
VNDAVCHTWDQLATDKPMPLLERQRVMGERMMISRVLLKKGCNVPTHAHQNEQFALVMSGTMRFGIGAEGSPQRREIIVSGGQVLHLPANVPHSAFAVEESVVLDLFSPPSATTGIDRP